MKDYKEIQGHLSKKEGQQLNMNCTKKNVLLVESNRLAINKWLQAHPHFIQEYMMDQ